MADLKFSFYVELEDITSIKSGGSQHWMKYYLPQEKYAIITTAMQSPWWSVYLGLWLIRLLAICLERFLDIYTIIHGASVSCKVIDVNHRRSPLVQGGLEIPCKITVMMKFSQENVCAMAEYTRITIQRTKRWNFSWRYPDNFGLTKVFLWQWSGLWNWRRSIIRS